MRIRIYPQQENALTYFTSKRRGRMRSRMAVKDIIDSALKRLGWTQAELADALGVSQPTVSRWKAGAEPDRKNWLKFQELAREREIDVPDLWNINQPGEQPAMVPVVGIVQAGAALLLYDEGQGPLGEVEAPPNTTPTMVAVEVRGDSVRRIARDGWTLYYDDRREPVTDDLIGRLCVIGLADGRVVVKELFRGSVLGRFHLHSTDADPIFDQEVVWAAPVEWIRPR